MWGWTGDLSRKTAELRSDLAQNPDQHLEHAHLSCPEPVLSGTEPGPGERPRPQQQERDRPGVSAGRGAKMKTNPVPEPAKEESVQSKFEAIRRSNQAAAKRLVDSHVSSSSSDEDNNEDNNEDGDRQRGKILESTFTSYTTQTGLLRTGQYLSDLFQSGALTCLICIASVKRTQPVERRPDYDKLCELINYITHEPQPPCTADLILASGLEVLTGDWIMDLTPSKLSLTNTVNTFIQSAVLNILPAPHPTGRSKSPVSVISACSYCTCVTVGSCRILQLIPGWFLTPAAPSVRRSSGPDVDTPVCCSVTLVTTHHCFDPPDEVEKECRCGKYRKQMACHKEYLCDSKCNCPPCDQICGRTLGCRNHKCPSVCHQGNLSCAGLDPFRKRCVCGTAVIDLLVTRSKKPLIKLNC
ncbi:hypothetical protein GOODEAATRI_027564 [Goodea atripinnis]|uniref:CXC domain-containing protein n=1 Tax=Goodea atripinnis TaxID=208336 RepID=A0ABV0PHP2_9TELE